MSLLSFFGRIDPSFPVCHCLFLPVLAYLGTCYVLGFDWLTDILLELLIYLRFCFCTLVLDCRNKGGSMLWITSVCESIHEKEAEQDVAASTYYLLVVYPVVLCHECHRYRKTQCVMRKLLCGLPPSSVQLETTRSWWPEARIAAGFFAFFSHRSRKQHKVLRSPTDMTTRQL